jgi:hypothetical protein
MQVPVFGQEPLRSTDPHPPIAIRTGQQRLRHNVGIDQRDTDLGVHVDGQDKIDAHRPITALAAANSAANASGARCTYFAVVSGEAWPINSRNTNRSIPAAASSVA